MPKVFLSFATEDLDFVTKLFTRLKRLEIDIWDYSNRDEEIAWGETIQEVLATRISDSDYFLPVVSRNSIDERKICIHYEVRFAVENKKKCFPVIISKRRPGDWTGAFELLKDRKYLEMDHEDDIDFEEKVCALCGSLNVIYQPDITDHNRLPLYKNLQKEIKLKLSEIVKLGERYIHEKLMNLVNQFNLSYSFGQWEKSLEIIKYFLAFNKHEIKDMKFYYPIIAKGVCELQLNLVEDAERTFSELVNNTKADENAFGGLGHVYFKQNKYEEALIQYNVALSKCPKEEDTEILYNILLTAIEILDTDVNAVNEELIFDASRIINNSDYIRRLDSKNYSNKKEKLRVKYLIGLGLFKSKNYKKAYGYFIDIYEKEIFDLSPDLFLGEFSNGKVSKKLHHEFKEKGFLIPVGGPIYKYSAPNETLEKENTWIILDGESIYKIYTLSDSIIVYYRELSFIIYFSQLLESLNQQKGALNMLKEEADSLNNRILFHHYANLLIRQGCIKEAILIYQNHICHQPYDKQFFVEYALLLKHAKAISEIKKICEMVVSQGMPKDRRECYYHGFAYFLIDKTEQAHAYYLDSVSYGKHYSLVV